MPITLILLCAQIEGQEDLLWLHRIQSALLFHAGAPGINFVMLVLTNHKIARVAHGILRSIGDLLLSFQLHLLLALSEDQALGCPAELQAREADKILLEVMYFCRCRRQSGSWRSNFRPRTHHWL